MAEFGSGTAETVDDAPSDSALGGGSALTSGLVDAVCPLHAAIVDAAAATMMKESARRRVIACFELKTLLLKRLRLGMGYGHGENAHSVSLDGAAKRGLDDRPCG